jgi:hypothetical protein
MMSDSDYSDEFLDRALGVLTSNVCLQIDPSLPDLCRCVVYGSESPADSSVPATWLCENTRFFTLIKAADGGTLVFCHMNETLYYASPAARLSPACPVNTAFLCQFTMDCTTHPTTPKTTHPRLLAFDVLCPGISCPHARGDILRSLSVHLPQPLCHVQWVGPRRFLGREFIAKLPHPASGVFCLGSDPVILGMVESI